LHGICISDIFIPFLVVIALRSQCSGYGCAGQSGFRISVRTSGK